MELTPKQIVSELNRYIIGQEEAKKMVAIALRNRYRRSRLPEAVREEITPKNIIMKGPTGVGKTEIARRLAKLVNAPFIKVEATKFTEVGYVGRDVDSMIRDLAEVAVRLVKEEKVAEVEFKAKAIAERMITNALLKAKKSKENDTAEEVLKQNILDDLRSGKYDNVIIDIEVEDAPKTMELIPGMGNEINLGSIMGGMFPPKKKMRKVTVAEGLKLLTLEQAEKMIDMDAVQAQGLKRAEQNGIIFIDEIDKIAVRKMSGSDVSREGVQRDILPIVEGCTVMTKYGAIKTDFILFIAAGAFHISSISDLVPELQGRFPILVELNSLKYEDFVKIFTEPENSVTMQYAELLKVDNINLIFKEDAIRALARIAVDENETKEDIGARRMHSIMEKMLEDVSYNASGDHPMVDVIIDEQYVIEHLNKEISNHDLKKYIL